MNKRLPICILLMIVFITGCAKADVAAPPRLCDSLPPRVGSAELTKTITGAKATEMSIGLHKGQLEKASDMAIGNYGPDISVWLSEYTSENAARGETDRMVKAMRHFGGDFGNVREIKISGRTAYITEVGGQPQYFWSSGKILVYVIAGEATKQDLEAVTRYIDPL